MSLIRDLLVAVSFSLISMNLFAKGINFSFSEIRGDPDVDKAIIERVNTNLTSGFRWYPLLANLIDKDLQMSNRWLKQDDCEILHLKGRLARSGEKYCLILTLMDVKQNIPLHTGVVFFSDPEKKGSYTKVITEIANTVFNQIKGSVETVIPDDNVVVNLGSNSGLTKRSKIVIQQYVNHSLQDVTILYPINLGTTSSSCKIIDQMHGFKSIEINDCVTYRGEWEPGETHWLANSMKHLYNFTVPELPGVTEKQLVISDYTRPFYFICALATVSLTIYNYGQYSKVNSIYNESRHRYEQSHSITESTALFEKLNRDYSKLESFNPRLNILTFTTLGFVLAGITSYAFHIDDLPVYFSLSPSQTNAANTKLNQFLFTAKVEIR